MWHDELKGARSRTMEGLLFYSTWQTNKLAWQNFIDVDRGHRTPRSKTKHGR